MRRRFPFRCNQLIQQPRSLTRDYNEAAFELFVRLYRFPAVEAGIRSGKYRHHTTWQRLKNLLKMPGYLFPCRPVPVTQLAVDEFSGLCQERQDWLVTFLSPVLWVIALPCPHLLAVKRMHSRISVNRNGFQRDIACRPDGFPHPPLNRLDLPGNADMQRIKEAPERALRRQTRNLQYPSQERITGDIAQLVEPYKADVNAQDYSQNELIRRHYLCRSFHRYCFFDELLKANGFEHCSHGQEATIRRQILPGEVIRRESPDFIKVRVNLIRRLFGAGFGAMLISVRNHLGVPPEVKSFVFANFLLPQFYWPPKWFFSSERPPIDHRVHNSGITHIS